MKNNKSIYKIHFIDENKKAKTIHASNVEPSSFLGLIEVSDIIFMDTSSVVINPDDEHIRKEFKDVEKTFLPLNSILRIDKILVEFETPVIRLYKNT